jgi:acetyl-CoA carboxylase biotin carboxyl carrier protein
MDLKEIKRLISIVEEANISHFSIEEDGIKIEVKKELGLAQTASVVLPQAVPQQVIQPNYSEPVVTKEATTNEPAGTEVKSQMVGTFYASTNPESAPFVKVGDRVEKGQVLCIVEAMKLFNEIESEISGTIEKICVSNATPVEFGKTLFIIKE